jgi:predicted LPLAT superfamily acyltransferase
MIRAGRGARVRCELAPDNAEVFDALLGSDRPALFGTFHFGCSDLLGYMLGERGRRVAIVRMRVDNSEDTRLMGERFGGNVSFLWMNDPAQLIFALKGAIEAGESVALKCDRPESSAKAEPFHFLGASRLFPFTIYHLAILFDRPVAFCTAVPGGTEDEIRVFASLVYTPDLAVGREPNLRAARVHFQAVLVQLETLVRQHPFLWFNYRPLNPVTPATDRVAGGRDFVA